MPRVLQPGLRYVDNHHFGTANHLSMVAADIPMMPAPKTMAVFSAPGFRFLAARVPITKGSKYSRFYRYDIVIVALRIG
jgi:hypothetical protein